MGNYLLSECRNRPYTAEDAALPPIAGEHVVQVLPQALVERAGLFPPMDVGRQVSIADMLKMKPYAVSLSISFACILVCTCIAMPGMHIAVQRFK